MNLPKVFGFLARQNRAKTSLKTEIQVLRERILRYTMVCIAAACIIGYLLLGISSLTQGDVFGFFIYSILTVIVINFALSGRINFNVKAFFLIAAIFGLAIYAFISTGLNGDGKLYMLGFTVITGILFGLIPSIAALVIAVITTAIFGFGMVNGFIQVPPPNSIASSSSALGWIIASVFLTALGLLTTLSISVLIANLQSNLQKEKVALVEAKEKSEKLEKIVDKTNLEINRRIQQIRNAYEISSLIGTSQDPIPLLNRVVDQMQQYFNLYYVGVFLIENNQFAVLKSGSGDPGKIMLAAGHRLQIGSSSMIGWCIANRSPRIALDVGSEAVRFNNPDLPETRSELALPIICRGDPLGAMTIQSRRPNDFDDNDIRIFQGIADSLAISLDNARLIERAQVSLNEIRSLNKTYLQLGWEKTISARGDLSYTFEMDTDRDNRNDNHIQIPMVLRDQKIGEITLDTEQPAFSVEDMEFIEAITVQTALALENARLIDETQRKAIQEEAVNRLSAEFSRGLNIDEIISTAMKEISHLPSVSEVSIFLGTPEMAATTNNNGHAPGDAA